MYTILNTFDMNYICMPLKTFFFKKKHSVAKNCIYYKLRSILVGGKMIRGN